MVLRKHRISRNNKVNWLEAPDVKKNLKQLLSLLNIPWVNEKRIYCFRSENTKTRAIARIWGLSKIWQKALGQEPAYILEVVSERFDKLNKIEKDKVLLHELTHIPKNFSGALVPHYRHGKNNFYTKLKRLMLEYTTNVFAKK